MIILHFIELALILYLLFSIWRQKKRTHLAINALTKFEKKITGHFQDVIDHVAYIRAAMQVVQTGMIIKEATEELQHDVEPKVKKISSKPPDGNDEIILLGELIP